MALEFHHPNGVLSLHVCDTGLSIVVGERSRLVTWSQLTQIVETGVPPPSCRWGVVIDGELAEVHPTRKAALDRQTEHRSHGSKVKLIRLPLEPV